MTFECILQNQVKIDFDNENDHYDDYGYDFDDYGDEKCQKPDFWYMRVPYGFHRVLDVGTPMFKFYV